MDVSRSGTECLATRPELKSRAFSPICSWLHSKYSRPSTKLISTLSLSSLSLSNLLHTSSTTLDHVRTATATQTDYETVPCSWLCETRKTAPSIRLQACRRHKSYCLRIHGRLSTLRLLQAAISTRAVTWKNSVLSKTCLHRICQQLLAEDRARSWFHPFRQSAASTAECCYRHPSTASAYKTFSARACPTASEPIFESSSAHNTCSSHSCAHMAPIARTTDCFANGGNSRYSTRPWQAHQKGSG